PLDGDPSGILVMRVDAEANTVGAGCAALLVTHLQGGIGLVLRAANTIQIQRPMDAEAAADVRADAGLLAELRQRAVFRVVGIDHRILLFLARRRRWRRD